MNDYDSDYGFSGQDCVEEQEAVFFYAAHDLLDIAEDMGEGAFARKIRDNFPELLYMLCGGK